MASNALEGCVLYSIGILSTGHLPPLLFPPSVLQNLTTKALQMVHKSHPNYVLANKAFNRVL